MGAVFLAEDAPHLSMEAMAAIHPNEWPNLTFALAEDIRRITTRHGGPEAWLAVNDDTDPAPAAAAADGDEQAWLIWRDEFQANFRAMDPLGAWALNEADGGATFAELCEGLTEWVRQRRPPDMPLAISGAGLKRACWRGMKSTRHSGGWVLLQNHDGEDRASFLGPIEYWLP